MSVPLRLTYRSTGGQERATWATSRSANTQFEYFVDPGQDLAREPAGATLMSFRQYHEIDPGASSTGHRIYHYETTCERVSVKAVSDLGSRVLVQLHPEGAVANKSW